MTENPKTPVTANGTDTTLARLCEFAEVFTILVQISEEVDCEKPDLDVVSGFIQAAMHGVEQIAYNILEEK